MVIAYLPLVLALVGALVYAIVPNAKAQELGRMCFFAGVIALAFTSAGAAGSLRIGH